MRYHYQRFDRSLIVIASLLVACPDAAISLLRHARGQYDTLFAHSKFKGPFAYGMTVNFGAHGSLDAVWRFDRKGTCVQAAFNTFAPPTSYEVANQA
jgi:hypothetical protein